MMLGHTNIRFELVVAIALVSPVLGCRFTETNTEHCNYNDGDAYCARQYPDGSRPFCEQGLSSCVSVESEYGCVPARPTDACYSPCGGESTLAVDDSCLMGGSSSSTTDPGMETSSESGSESSSSTTGPIPCVGNEDCPEALEPFCEPASGECVACDAMDDPDGACATEDPSMPVCVGGACVQCTAVVPEACVGATPVCDDASNTCVPCSEHDQCGEAACNLFTGACLPSGMGNVVHAGPGQEFPTIGDAVASFDMGTEGTIIIHGNGSFDEATTVDGARTLAFLANDGELPRWILSGGGSPQLTVGDATVLMDGIQVSGNASTMAPGMLVDGGRAWVDRGRIVTNAGGGIVAQNTAELVTRNCFVGGNVDDVDGVALDASSLTMLYTTVGAGGSFVAESRAVSCSGASAADIRNSVLLSADTVPELQCPGATIAMSALESTVGFDPGWFNGYITGDFSLTMSGMMTFADLATWESGDPATDIDGDLRPDVDGSSDFAGADVP